MMNSDSNKDIRKEFLNEMQSQSGLDKLFEFIPDTHFLIKNKNFEFVAANQLFCEKCGCANEKDIIGKNDYDFFHEDLIKNYRIDDTNVIQHGQKIKNRIELVPNEDATVDWYCTNKIPVYSKSGEIIGLAAISKLMGKADMSNHPLTDLAEVISYISQNYSRNIDMNMLAAKGGYSLSQFERRFKQALKVTPEKFINTVRIRAACKALANSRESIKSIADSNGFCNQSYFSKQFKENMGLSPKEYRQKYFKGD